MFKALEGTISHCWDMVGASYKQVTVACTAFQSYLQLMFMSQYFLCHLPTVSASEVEEMKVKTCLHLGSLTGWDQAAD